MHSSSDRASIPDRASAPFGRRRVAYDATLRRPLEWLAALLGGAGVVGVAAHTAVAHARIGTKEPRYCERCAWSASTRSWK